MKKKIKNTLIATTIASVGILGACATSATQILNNITLTNDSVKNVDENEYLNINSSQGYDLVESGVGAQVCYGKSGSIAVRESDIDSTYKQIIYVDNTTGKVVWKYDNELINIMSVIYTSDAATPYFTVLCRNASGETLNEMFLINILEKDGSVAAETEIDNIGTDYKDYCLYQCTNAPHRFTLQNRRNISDANRNGYNYEVTTSNDPSIINVTKKDWVNTSDSNTNYFVVGSGSYAKGNDIYDVRMLVSENSGHRIYFKIYKNFNELYKWDTTIDYDNGVYGDSSKSFDIDLADALNQGIYVSLMGDELSFGTFKTGDNAACFFAKYNVSTGKFNSSQTQQFQPNSFTTHPNADMDISTFDIRGDEFVLMTSYAAFSSDGYRNPVRGAIITGNFVDLDNDDTYFDWTDNEGWTISLYKNLKDSIKWTDYLGLKVSISKDGLISIEQGETNTLYFEDPDFNGGEGGNNFNTFNYKKVPTRFAVTGKENTQLTNDMISNLSNVLSTNYINYDISDCFVNWRSDAVISATPINTDDNTQYKGTVQFKLSTTNYYENGTLLSNYNFPGIYTLTGYKAYTTKPANAKIYNKAFEGKNVEDINNDEIIAQVKKNLTTLINDIPDGIDLSLVDVSVSNGFFGKYKTVSVTLPAHFNSNHELVDGSATYSFTLNGFIYKQGLMLEIVLPIVIILMIAAIVASILLYLKHKRDEAIEYVHIDEMLDKDFWN